VVTLPGRERIEVMTTADPFGRTDRLDSGVLETLAARFEARGQHPQFSKMLQTYLEAMRMEAATSVLDIGCGTGLVARVIARQERFDGKVTGVDLSPYLVATARRLAQTEGAAAHTEFQTGDAQRLEFADGTFDAAVAHTLLSHVADPLVTIKEAARVVKAGGMVGFFDGDYASLTFGHPDPLKGKALDEALIRAVVTNPRIMRQMPRLLPAVGLELVASFGFVLTEIGRANFWGSAIEAYRRLIPKAGVMTDDEAEAWAVSLRSDSDAGVFFGSCNYYAYVARRL
jgi:ubiquinone/menaquinone biosynthesis C-methylase UbiE